MEINWQPLDHDNPPRGRVLFYFKQPDGWGTHYIQHHYYHGLTELGKTRVTHWSKPNYPGVEEDVS